MRVPYLTEKVNKLKKEEEGSHALFFVRPLLITQQSAAAENNTR